MFVTSIESTDTLGRSSRMPVIIIAVAVAVLVAVLVAAVAAIAIATFIIATSALLICFAPATSPSCLQPGR